MTPFAQREEALVRLWYYGYAADHEGLDDDAVAAAVRAYQRDWELPEDGVLDEEMHARLTRQHPDTMRQDQKTVEGRCVIEDTLPDAREIVSHEGDCPDGLRQGEGRTTRKYLLLGEWQEGTESGIFVDGKLNGHGALRWSDGTAYEGDFVDGKRTGHGIERTENYVYEGELVDGFNHGYGIIRWADGDVYEGEWVDGARMGHGTFRWANGDVYEGDFVDGARTGQGTYRWADGDVYEGDFVDGVRTGYGTYRWADGDVYEGDFVDDALNGYGTFRWADGTVAEGYWVDDVLQD